MDLSQRFFASLRMTMMTKKQPVFAKLAGPKRHITTTYGSTEMFVANRLLSAKGADNGFAKFATRRIVADAA